MTSRWHSTAGHRQRACTWVSQGPGLLPRLATQMGAGVAPALGLPAVQGTGVSVHSGMNCDASIHLEWRRMNLSAFCLLMPYVGSGQDWANVCEVQLGCDTQCLASHIKPVARGSSKQGWAHHQHGVVFMLCTTGPGVHQPHPAGGGGEDGVQVSCMICLIFNRW